MKPKESFVKPLLVKIKNPNKWMQSHIKTINHDLSSRQQKTGEEKKKVQTLVRELNHKSSLERRNKNSSSRSNE